MRLHIDFDDDLVAEHDRRVGPRGRSVFIARAVEQALDAERRWDLIESAVGAIADTGHDWDADPAEWVSAQRHADGGRIG